MALANGRIEGVVPLFLVNGSSGASLRFGSCARWNAIRAEVLATYGWAPEVTSAGDGYRSLARQETLFFRNYQTSPGYGPTKFYEGTVFYRRTANTPSAATPGSSNHGLGTTVDVVGVGHLNQYNPTTERFRQFAAVAARHGFSNAEGRSIGEPWHWTDTLDPDDAYGASAPEEDMALTTAELALLTEVHAALGAGGAIGLPAANTVLGRLTTVQGQVNGVPQAFTATRQEIAAVKADTGTIKANTTGVPEAFATTNGKVDAVKADTSVIRTDCGVIKAGVATLIERPAAAGGAAGPALDVNALVEQIADAVIARLASVVVTITPEV